MDCRAFQIRKQKIGAFVGRGAPGEADRQNGRVELSACGSLRSAGADQLARRVGVPDFFAAARRRT